MVCDNDTHTPSFTHHLSHTISHTPSSSLSFTHHLSHTSSHTPSFIFHRPSFTHGDTLRGTSGTWRQPPSFCAAGVALMALGLLWWRAWAGISRRWRRGTLRGRRGTWRHVPSFHVAGVALGDIHLRFAWQARHLWHWAGSGQARGLGLVAALCVAGVALGDMCLRFTRQARYLATSTFVLRGGRGTYGTDMCLRFTWQAWHLATSTIVLRGRRGTYGTGLALVARLGWDYSRRWRRGTLRGRRGTWRHVPSFHVAGVALGDIYLRFAWQAWHLWHCGALGLGFVAGDAAALCVAGGFVWK